MAERIEELDVGVLWEPNAPEAVLTGTDDGRAVLVLRAHPNDPDQRSVALAWSEVRHVSMGDPNDEAIAGHPLAEVGLTQLAWIGLVRDSALTSELERRGRAHDRHDPARFAHLHHFVVPLKECLVEVVADRLAVDRIMTER